MGNIIQPRPAGWSRWHADAFQDADVAAAYSYREPYPDEVFATLAGLFDAESDAALDIGCGRGELARRMLDFAGRVDAVDASAEMLASGRELPGGDSPRLNWIHGRIEEVALPPPYGLITAGKSLHWMDWHILMPRLSDALTKRGALAIIDCHMLPALWDDEMNALIARYSTNKDFQSLDLIGELESRGLFVKQGERRIDPTPFSQSIEETLEAYHSTSGLTRVRMGAEDTRAFDEAARALLTRHAPDGIVRWQVVATIVWGRPQRSPSADGRDTHSDHVI